MAEVVSDSEPSPLEALRTGLNMVAALAVLDATSGTGIPPGEYKGTCNYFTIIKDTLTCQHLGGVAVTPTLSTHLYSQRHTDMQHQQPVVGSQQ